MLVSRSETLERACATLCFISVVAGAAGPTSSSSCSDYHTATNPWTRGLGRWGGGGGESHGPAVEPCSKEKQAPYPTPTLPSFSLESTTPYPFSPDPSPPHPSSATFFPVPLPHSPPPPVPFPLHHDTFIVHLFRHPTTTRNPPTIPAIIAISLLRLPLRWRGSSMAGTAHTEGLPVEGAVSAHGFPACSLESRKNDYS